MKPEVFTRLICAVVTSSLASPLATGQVNVKAHSDIAPPSEYTRHYDGAANPDAMPWAWAKWAFLSTVALQDDEFLHGVLAISKRDSAALAQRASRVSKQARNARSLISARNAPQ